jgi:SWIM zinc finger
MNERQQKALEIAAKTKLKKNGKHWGVPSQTGNGDSYKVDNANPDWPTCTCPDFELRHAPCKHIYAVEYTMERERKVTTTVKGDTTTTTVTETVKIRYKQVWAAYNSAQTNEKAKFLELLHALCSNVDEPIQTMGRTRLPMSDMLFATVFKIYESVSSRRYMTDLKEAYVRRYISKLPCYNSINGYLEKEELTP